MISSNPYNIDEYSEVNGRFNLTESALAKMPEEDAAEWRKCWTTYRHVWQADFGPRFYFLRVLDRFDFEQTLLMLGNVTVQNSDGETRTDPSQRARS
jgi:hypothetical protein